MLLALALPGGQGFAAVAKGGSTYQKALEDYRALKYDEALQVLGQKSQSAPPAEQQVSMDLLEGVIRFEMGEAERARDLFRKALSRDSKAQLAFDVSPKITDLLEEVRRDLPPPPPPVLNPPPPVLNPPVIESEGSVGGNFSQGLSAARVPLAIAGGGVAVVGVLSWVKALSVAQQIKQADSSITTKDQLDGLVRQGKTFETAGWILAGAGAATALGSLLLIHPSSTTPAAMAVPTRGGAYVSLDWRIP